MVEELTLSEAEQYWHDHIQACETSGKTISAYTAENNLRMWKFHNWKNRLIKKGLVFRSRRKYRFQKVSIAKGISGERENTKIHFPNGMVLEWNGVISEKQLISFLSHWV